MTTTTTYAEYVQEMLQARPPVGYNFEGHIPIFSLPSNKNLSSRVVFGVLSLVSNYPVAATWEIAHPQPSEAGEEIPRGLKMFLTKRSLAYMIHNYHAEYQGGAPKIVKQIQIARYSQSGRAGEIEVTIW